MSNPNLRLPEPTLPEHALIRDAAPEPQLSAGFRERVLSECRTSIARSRAARRWKITGSVAAFCCLCLTIFLVLPTGPVDAPQMAEPAPTERLPTSRSHSLGYPGADSALSVTEPRPTGNDPEKVQMNEIVDGLNQRQQLFDANMLPKF
ncbi:MAG: hypothetical protein RIK87_18225 [Fuerstiella sp.]